MQAKHVFISYAKEELPCAEAIRDVLESYLVEVFLAPDSIPKGRVWKEEVERNMAQSDVLLLLWSQNAANSKWVNYEIACAKIGRVRIIPIRLDSTATHTQLQDVQALFWKSGDDTASLKAIVESLGLPATADLDRGISDTELDAISAEEAYRKAVISSFRHLLVLGHDQGLAIQEAYLPLRMRTCDAAHKEPVVAHERIESASKRLIILGNPGSGKTTLLRYVAHRCATNNYLIPILIRIDTLMRTASTLIDHVHNLVQGKTNRTIADMLTGHDDFCQEGTLLLLDGLDEVNETTRASFLERLQAFLIAYPQCKVVISSRVSNFRKDDFQSLHFEFYQIVELSEEDIKNYVWDMVPEDRRNDLWLLLKSSDRLFELAHIPFMLAMLCTSRLEPGKVIDRASLFANCTEYLLRKRARGDDGLETDAITTETYGELESVLKAIAVRFFKLDSGDCFDQEDLEFAVRKTVPQGSSTNIISHLVDQTGLLQRAGEEYSFVHRSIGEYYVARGMQDEPFKNLISRASVPSWEEPIKLFVGLTDKESLDRVIHAIWDRNRGLALRALTELPQFPEELLRRLIDGLEREERVRLSYEIIGAANRAASSAERKRILIDSVTAIFRVETDCEVIYNCIIALIELGDPDCSQLVEDKLNLKHAEERRREYLANPDYHLDFISIHPQEFLMGYDDSPDAREHPAHRVRISPFQIARFPTVNTLYYDSFPFAANRRGLGGYSTGDAQPVNNISWFEAMVFAWWLGCDLPTEAEWEYACRSGGEDDSTLFDRSKIPEYAWYEGNSENRTHEVGQKKCNSLGLYDMLGNVREWVKDTYSETEYYKHCKECGVIQDPLALGGSDRKVLRGGVFDWSTRNLRPTYRPMNPPDNVFFGNGMRLVYRKGMPVPFMQKGWSPET